MQSFSLTAACLVVSAVAFPALAREVPLRSYPPMRVAAARTVPHVEATFFYVQVYDVKEGKMDAFKKWFKEVGGPALKAFPGVVTVETYVDEITPGPLLKTIIGFTDCAAYERWDNDATMNQILEPLDSMAGPHKHYLFPYNPLYRSKSLSLAPSATK